MGSQELQSTFDELISKYMTLKKQVFEDVMRDQTSRDKYSQYFGKSVYYDGAYWYINNYGVAHKYTPGGTVWKNKSKSCPQSISASVDLSDFPKGPIMTGSQACGVAGNNVMNESSGEIAWVDIQGNKHMYGAGAYENRPPSCQKEPKLLSNIEYNAIPDGPPMTKDDYCLTANINKNDYHTLQQLNIEILEVAKQLIQDNAMLSVEDESVRRQVEKQRVILNQQIERLEKERRVINERVDEIETLGVENRQDERNNIMYSTNSLMYGLSTIVLGYMIIRLL